MSFVGFFWHHSGRILGEAIPAEFIQVFNGKSLTQLEFLMKNAEVRLRRMMFGSWQPPIAAPPNQEYFNDMSLCCTCPAHFYLRPLSGLVEILQP